MMSKLRSILLIAFAVITAVLFVIFGFLVYNYSVGYGNHSVKNRSRNSISHKQSLFDPSTGRVTNVIAHLGRVLKGEEYFHFRNEKGHAFTITRLDSKMHRCGANCYCDDERRSVAALGKSLLFLVPAVSSAMALSISARYFSEQCSIEYGKECTNVRAEVDDCTEEKEEPTFSKDSTPTGKMLDWRCEGHCKKNPYLLGEMDIEATETECEKQDVSSPIDATDSASAKQLFEKELDEFCSVISEIMHHPFSGPYTDEKYYCYPDPETVNCFQVEYPVENPFF